MTSLSAEDSPTWRRLLTTLLSRTDLTRTDTAWAMEQVVRGLATPAQVAGFLTALRAKGERAAEIAGLLDALRAAAEPVPIPGPIVDIAGTGGDGSGAVNISTMAAIVAAAAGAWVVKHGGRAASSTTGGSADLLEHLGIPLRLTADQARQVMTRAGITFLFAPQSNPALRQVAAVRRELAVPTAFNILAPLLNPADPAHVVVGVADARMVPVLADVLALRGRTGLVVRGADGLDKFTTVTTSQVFVVRDGAVTASEVDPATWGIPRAEPAALRGGGAAQNARVLRAVLAGERGPIRDVVLLNAAAVLAALSPAPLAGQLAAGMARAARAVDTGAARAVLDRWLATVRSQGRSRGDTGCARVCADRK